jgi:hypothetical protein
MMCSSGLIGCVYKMMHMRDRGPCIALYSSRDGVTRQFKGESTSRTRLGVLYMDSDMTSFLTEY